MTVEFERALSRHCDADTRLRLLQAQWEYDRQLVAQALQAVPIYFAHYSRHDVSHSNTILVQIARVLGARIDRLSATDLWLLLEAAYWHDIGMVIDDETARRWMRDDDFVAHLSMLELSDDPALAAAAALVKKLDPEVFVERTWALDVRKAVTLVMADYGRKRHSLRSGELVRHPMAIGVSSPRALIPERLFDWLAEITTAHAWTREEVMELPERECGLGTDFCHPRFVAFMLRLGDLLDLDNGRFCPVLTRSIGALPISSMDHVGKHASIRRFHVSPQRVEVSAVCSDPTKGGAIPNVGHGSPQDPYGPYEAITEWLTWLTQELQFLATHWADLAPHDFGGAPSVGTIEAKLEGFKTLERGKRPRFQVDEPAFLALVRSNNLYNDRHAWLYELLSNASDATLLRAKHDHPRAFDVSGRKDLADHPFGDVPAILNEYPISIQLEVPKEAPGSCRVTISDQGTGISLEDLPFILTIGSSQRNRRRRLAIEGIPEHLRPTGSFGIGLQSVFMVTNELLIRSMHFGSRDRLHIRIRRFGADDSATKLRVDALNGQARERAGVYIRELGEGDEPTRPGTQVTFSFELRTNGQLPSDPNVDPIQASGRLAEVEALRAKIQSLADSLLVTIFRDGTQLVSANEGGEDRLEVKLFDPKTNCFLRFQRPTEGDNPVELLYRGARVEEHTLGSLGLVKVSMDAKFGRASDLLAASRERLTDEGKRETKERFQRALAETFPEYLKRLAALAQSPPPGMTKDVVELAHRRASLFAAAFLARPPFQGSGDQAWKDLAIFHGGKVNGDQLGLVAMHRLAEEPRIGFVVRGVRPRDPLPSEPALTGEAAELNGLTWFELELSDSSGDNRRSDWVREMLLRLFPHSTFYGTFVDGTQRYVLSREPSEHGACTEDALKQRIKSSMPERNTAPARLILPCRNEYAHLQLDPEKLPGWVKGHGLLVNQILVTPVEFSDRDGDLVGITTRNLRAYVEWLMEFGVSRPDETPDLWRKAVRSEIAAFFKLLRATFPQRILDAATKRSLDDERALSEAFA